MPRKLPMLSLLTVLLVMAAWPAPAGGIVNVGTASSFTYICNVTDMMANATEVDNLEYDDMGLSLRTANWGWANRYSYVMWHFQTGNAATTFGTDLKISGRYNNIDPGWGDCAGFVFASTSSSTPVYQWTPVKSFYGVQNDATWTLEELGAQFGGGTDLYVAVAIRTPSSNTGNRMLAQLFRSVDGAHPFVLTGSLNSTSQAKEAVNLLSEPDFEESTAGGWVWSRNLSPTASWSFSATPKYSGAQCVKFTYGSNYFANRWARFTQTVPVHANSAYEFSAYVKGTTVTASGAALAAGSNAATRVYFPSGTFDWTRYSLTIDSGTNTSLPFLFHLERKVTALYVDDVKLTEIFLGNSGFEKSLSSPSPWTYSVQGSPVQSGSVVSGVSGNSGRCFKFTYGSAQNGDDGARIIQTVSNLRPNTRYVAEVRYKGTGVGWAAMITGLNWTIFKFFPTGDTPDWTTMVMPFETDGTGATWPFVVQVKSTTTELYVDDIKIYRDCDYHCHDAAADSANLIKGPSFEKATDLRVGDYTRWWLSQGASGGDATAAVITSENLRGGKSLRLAGNTAPWGDNKHSALLQWADSLSANTTYRLTASVKGTDVREACLMADWTNRAYLPFGTYDWTPVSLDFTTGSTGGSVIVGLMALNRMTAICLDNVSLRPLTKTTAAPLVGGDVAQVQAV
ncbi:MAG: carbohydrate binding domain-containing protein, partial [Lentisphaeria bacterium]